MIEPSGQPTSGNEIDANRVRRWTGAELAKRCDVPKVTCLRSLVPAMVSDGVLARRGRTWWARPADIDAWLCGRWTAPKRGTRG